MLAFKLIELDRHAGCREIQIEGELDLAVAGQLQEALDRAGEEYAQVLISLENCEFIDSTGIALIVRAWQRVDAGAGNGGKGGLVLCCQNDQVRRVLEVTGLEHSLRVFETRDAGLAALRG